MPATAKEFLLELQAMPLTNYAGTIQWLTIMHRLDRRTKDYFNRSHLSLFEKKLGKPYHTYEQYEFKYKVWKVSYGGELYFIFSARNKGTWIEAQISPTMNGDKAIGFMDNFYLRELFDYQLP